MSLAPSFKHEQKILERAKTLYEKLPYAPMKIECFTAGALFLFPKLALRDQELDALYNILKDYARDAGEGKATVDPKTKILFQRAEMFQRQRLADG